MKNSWLTFLIVDDLALLKAFFFAASVIVTKSYFTALLSSDSSFYTSKAIPAATSQNLAHPLPFIVGSSAFFF